ncbi:hypothetical protein PG999_001553 [Apiospora kogelbergensis]|uniref:Uncharacterized protein n=1 Tax=Apiospora kogelbergensis TaxID=1337665 RepID=A0AAW0R5V2_9PEZI
MWSSSHKLGMVARAVSSDAGTPDLGGVTVGMGNPNSTEPAPFLHSESPRPVSAASLRGQSPRPVSNSVCARL